MFEFTRRAATVVLVVASIAVAGPANAQDIQYKNVSRVKFQGALGTMMNLAAKLGGGGGDSEETHYIKGSKLRYDADKSSNIADLEAVRFIDIKHESKTYTVLTLQQINQAMEASAAQARQAQAQARAQQTSAPAQSQGEMNFKFDLKVDRTGEKQKVNGYDAERFILTMKTDMKYKAEGATQEEAAGTIVVLNDMWNSKDVPIQQAMERMQKDLPKALRRSGAQNMGAAFATQPQLGAALKKTAEEAEKLEGMSMKSTTHIILLPPGVEFDRALALGSDKGNEKQGGGLKGLAGGALGGMLGAKKQDQQKAQEPKPQQMTLAIVTTEIRDVQLKSLPASLFEPPAGYKEVPFTMPTAK